MAKKYVFNPDNFDYTEDTKIAKIIKFIFGQIFIIVGIALSVFYALSFFTDSPREKNLKHQTKLLKKEYDKLYAQYIENENNLKLLEQTNKDLYSVIFATPYTDSTISDLPKMDDLHGRKAKKLARKQYKELESLLHNARKERKNLEKLVEYISKQRAKIQNIPSIYPVPVSASDFPVYGYGIRLDPVYHIPVFHNGIDIKVPFGTPVLATANGKIVEAGFNAKRGKYIIISHGKYRTGYFHLQKILIRKGEKVEKGEVIGYVGSSGKSLVAHLHYEVIYKGTHVNPLFFCFASVNPSKFRKLYEKSVTAGIALD